jgi:hypothetical protein
MSEESRENEESEESRENEESEESEESEENEESEESEENKQSDVKRVSDRVSRVKSLRAAKTKKRVSGVGESEQIMLRAKKGGLNTISEASTDRDHTLTQKTTSC